MKTRTGLFITGTDTGVGKTFVTAALASALLNKKANVAPFKPVQTGAPEGTSPDLDFVMVKSGFQASAVTYPMLAPVCLPLAASPHLAARSVGRKLSVRKLAAPILAYAKSGGLPLVEGAGGLMVPLNEKETMLDLMQALAFPVILVARPGLGTLNHTLLSAHALDSAVLSLAAVVISHCGPWGAIEKDNKRSLARRLNCPVLVLPDLQSGSRSDFIKAGKAILGRLDTIL